MRPVQLSLLAFSLAASLNSVNAKTLSISSPDGHLMVSVSDENNQPSYRVSFDGQR